MSHPGKRSIVVPDRKYTNYDVCVYGLGFVGLTLSVVLAESGLKVYGIDKDAKIIEGLKLGIPHFFEPELPQLLSLHIGDNLQVSASGEGVSAKVHVIAVGTPIDSNHKPILDSLIKASKSVAKNLKAEDLVIVRSTVFVGATRTLIKPILDSAMVPYSLAFCPERTLEGKAIEELRLLPQVCSGLNALDLEKAKKFFSLYNSQVSSVSSLETAEFIKLIDNTYRDVTFGFANEIERIGLAHNLNPYEAIRVANSNYDRTNIPLPGPVGGPCLSKDPFILGHNLDALGINFSSTITYAARMSNESYIDTAISTVKLTLKSIKDPESNRSILILGAAFKGSPQTNDVRNSLPLSVAKKLLKEKIVKNVYVYDDTVNQSEIEALGFIYLADKDIHACNFQICLLGHTETHVQTALQKVLKSSEANKSDATYVTFWASKSSILEPIFSEVKGATVMSIYSHSLITHAQI
jgi:UDP-N-acetyl-D-mannosaminuronic acid dehydrogenase